MAQDKPERRKKNTLSRPKMAEYHLKSPVFFVGFMGAGKTSVARRLARICRVASVDMDVFIERQENKKVSEIFADEGEKGFRAHESAVLYDFAHHDPLFVSCGGGIILAPENRRLLKEEGFTVYLMVSADEASHRISDISTRPLFKNLETARATHALRHPLYQEVAHAVVSTEGKDVGRIAQEVKSILLKEEILWQSLK